MSDLRVAIVGTGFGVRTQLPAFQRVGGWQVTSLTGRDAERTRSLAETHGVPHALGPDDDPSEVGEPDLVCVTSPPALHLPQGLQALARDRHCLLEKPMTLDADEAARLVAAVRPHRLALIDHELRALPGHQAMRQRLQAGDVGRPLELRVRFTSHGRAQRGAHWNWWASREAGGGLLGAIGSHVIDMITWWLGPVTAVRARLTTAIDTLPDPDGAPRPVETDDGADLLLTFASGLSGTVTLTAVAHHYEGITWEVHGTEGSLWLRPDGRLIGAARGRDATDDLTPDDPLGSEPILDGTLWARGFVTLATDLGRAIREGGSIPYAATFTDGLGVQRVLDACRKSAASAASEDAVPVPASEPS